jgi:WD40 repeat protein/energy-coupling factor transporter ATP-binding protein EcfA2
VDDLTAGLARSGAWALLVATGTHAPDSALPPVPIVADAVRDLGQVLVERCGLPETNLRVLVDPDDPKQFGTELRLAATQASDVLFFFYVGHGLLSPGGELHFATRATSDLNEGLAAYEAMPHSAVRDVLTAHCRARLIVIILDCCFAGRAWAPGGRLSDAAFEIPYIRGEYLLTSAARLEEAFAPVGEPYPAFTGELLRLLRDGDPAGPRRLTIDHAYRYLSRALSARRLPLPHRQVIDRSGDLVLAPNAAYREPVLPSRREASPEDAVAADEEACPYPGLASFNSGDAAHFFGRERLTAQLVSAVAAQLHRSCPLMVVGPSGCGKSSLLRAGLLPALAGGSLAVLGSREWPALVITPRASPLTELAAKLAIPGETEAAALEAELRANPSASVMALRQLLRGPRDYDPSSRLVLIVDQFEELFTLCGDEEERLAFVEALAAACAPEAEGHVPPALVILSVRADFYGQCASYAPLVQSMEECQLVVGPMSLNELRDAIEGPARATGMLLQHGLVDELLHDLGADAPAGYAAGRLPLLSHALLSTWQQREGRQLTLAGYQATGRIRDSVARTAERAYAGFDASDQEIARRLLLRMVQVGQGSEHTRRRAQWSELMGGRTGKERSAVLRVVGDLVTARLLTADESAVEITHEALLLHWPRLREWIETDRADLLTHQRLDEDAHAWQHEGRDQSYLYGGTRLGAAVGWADRNGHRRDLTEVELAFLDASVRRERRRTRSLYQVIAGLSALLLIAVGVSVFALEQRGEAIQQQRIATGRELTAEAGALRDSQPRVSLMLSLEAVRLDSTGDARAGLLTTLTQTHYAGMLSGHTAAVNAVAFSPDGHTMATASDDRTVILWGLGDRSPPARLATLSNMGGQVFAVAFSPDGHTLAAAGLDHTATLWDLSNRAHPAGLATITGSAVIEAVAFSPDSHTLAIGGWDNAATLWDLSDRTHPTHLATLVGHTGHVITVAYSPDGHTLATGSWDGTAILWDLSDRARPARQATLGSPTQDVSVVAAFSPDGNTLATASDKLPVILWDISDRANPTPLATLTYAGWPAVAFSPNGHTLAMSSDRAALLWDLTDRGHPTQVATFSGHTDSVDGIAFSPDGRVLATGSRDRTAILWSISDPSHPASLATLGGHTDFVHAVAFSPDGHTVATSRDDRKVILWEVSDRAHPVSLASLSGPAGQPSSGRGAPDVAFSPDGRILVTGGEVPNTPTVTGMAILWDLRDRARPSRLATLGGDISAVVGVAYSPDGRTLATATIESGAAIVWDVHDRVHPAYLSTFSTVPISIQAVTFSPDGKTVVTSRDDSTAMLWDVSDRYRPTHLATLRGHTDWVNSAAFSPDGRILVTGSDDRTAILWDVGDRAHPTRLTTLGGHSAQVEAVAFSPDGHTLATASLDGTAILWDVSDLTHPVRLATLVGSSAAVAALAFSPDSRTLVTGGDGGAMLWDVTDITAIARHPVSLACEEAGPTLSRDEWARYVRGLSYERVCP